MEQEKVMAINLPWPNSVMEAMGIGVWHTGFGTAKRRAGNVQEDNEQGGQSK